MDFSKQPKKRKQKDDLYQTSTSSSSKQQRLENLLIRSLICSKCSEAFDVEAISNITSPVCYFCSRKPNNTDICGGYPFEMVDDETQLAQNFQCPICLLILRNTTELPCNHLMCAKCLIRNEGILSRALPDLR